YIGCVTSDTLTKKILEEAVKNAGLYGLDQQLAYPLITKSGVNQSGKRIHYYFNYSSVPKTFKYPFSNGKELISNIAIAKNKSVQLEPWGFKIIEEN
ncbi:MAG TPA: beta-galactosidase, partial [Segetibacter sp.]